MVRRKKLMLLYGAAGLAVTALAVAILISTRPANEAYEPGGEVEGITDSLARSLPSDHPTVQFQDVSADAGLHFQHFGGERSSQLPEDMGSGAAWGDFDQDGHVDLFISNIAGPLSESDEQRRQSSSRNRLFRGSGDGTFADVTESSGVGDRMTAMGAAWGDWNADGYPDLVVTSFGGIRLYRNERDGTFADVTVSAGLDGHVGFWTGASWGDFDRDTDVDLYVTGYVQYAYRAEDAGRGTRQYQSVVPYTLNPSSYEPERNLLLRNNGNATFTEVGAAAGVDNPQGRSLAAAWCDFDEDGWLDLYVANDVSDNVLFRNNGDGTFADVSHPYWVADYRGAMGLAVSDWDADGDQDIFVTHWIAQENALYSNLRIAFGGGGGESSPGETRFMDVADMMGLGQIALDVIGWGTFFFDYDNDGRVDIFVANGSTFQEDENPAQLVAMPSQLFWNGGGDRGFFEVGPVAGEFFSSPRVARGAAPADYDGDGDLDVVVVNHGREASLLRNDGGHLQNWIIVEPRSNSGNRFGLGAKVHVEAGGRTQYAQIGSQPSYLSQAPPEAHFGLGDVDRVDRIVVEFLGGARVERRDVAARQRLMVKEDKEDEP